jgi:predicted acylesterase/phospholipase RssA
VSEASRDAAVVLSGGGINGVLLELGFLKRLRETPFWDRIGWIYGTSAGALAGSMAALDRLDDLEAFLLSLHADDVFRPRRLWQLPLGGLRDYTLPATIAGRLGDPEELGSRLAESEVELVVFATDVSDHLDADGTRSYELAYSSHSVPAEVMGRAILASAAVSALVLPIPIEEVIATDGGWVRNFPLEHAEANPGVGAVAAFRYIASYRPLDVSFLERLRERLERFRAVPPVRGILAEIRLAEERARRGEPAHYPELIIRLMRVAIARNTVQTRAPKRARRPGLRRPVPVSHGSRGRPPRGARGARRGRPRPDVSGRMGRGRQARARRARLQAHGRGALGDTGLRRAGALEGGN